MNGNGLAALPTTRRPVITARLPADPHGGEACVTISMSRAERADLGQREHNPERRGGALMHDMRVIFIRILAG
jgi:hypothetical protein